MGCSRSGLHQRRTRTQKTQPEKLFFEQEDYRMYGKILGEFQRLGALQVQLGIEIESMQDTSFQSARDDISKYPDLFMDSLSEQGKIANELTQLLRMTDIEYDTTLHYQYNSVISQINFAMQYREETKGYRGNIEKALDISTKLLEKNREVCDLIEKRQKQLRNKI